MIAAGLTGGIGSGKSTVARIFETLCVPVYHADGEARKFYALPEVIKGVVAIFGDDVFDADRKLQAAVLAGRAFADPVKLARLNALIHPLVMQDFVEWTGMHRDAQYVVLESAILYETGLDKGFSHIIVVDASRQLCMQRVMKRDNTSAAEVAARMDRQIDPEEKKARADFLIINDEKTALLPQVLNIHDTLTSASRA